VQNRKSGVDLATGIVTLVGRYSEEASKLLAELNIYKLGVADASKAVTFSRNQNVWAFDGAEDPYMNSTYYADNYSKVTYLGSKTIYRTPWQFLPKGGAPQEVKATIPEGYDMAQMKFVTSTGLDITPKEGGGRDLILALQPASGEELYLVYAFLMNADGTATYCGAMNVMTRSIKTYKAKLVKLGGTYSLETLRTELNNIYNPCGIVWELEEDLAFGTDPEYLDALTTILNEGVGPENNDAFFSEYTANQKALNSLYRLYSAGKSTYDDKTVYLFALPQKDGHLGDMPIGKQWGYLFGNVEANVLAHELGHGKLSLAHTFAHNLTEGATAPNSNLMDYPVGTELVARQWESAHDLAMLDPFQDDADGATINNEIVKGIWKKVDPPQIYAGKAALKYNSIFIPIDPNIRNTHTLIQLVDGSKFLASPNQTGEVGMQYSIKLPSQNDYCQVFLSTYENKCLSCELTWMLEQMAKTTGTTAGRYVLPVEDFYIVLTGENFDGDESSRIAAGGFIILEVVQVGKVMKLVKGAKIITASGNLVNPSLRIFKRYATEVTKEAVVDMSVQFLINFVDQSIKNPNKDFDEIAGAAFSSINVKDAIISGMIDYSSFDERTKTAYDCAAKMFRRMQNGEYGFSADMEKGFLDCIILVGVRYGFSKLKGNGRMQELANVIADARNYDIVLDKLSKIMTAENIIAVTKKFTEEGIIKGAENVWK
jgi:hypothetical protein